MRSQKPSKSGATLTFIGPTAHSQKVLGQVGAQAFLINQARSVFQIGTLFLEAFDSFLQYFGVLTHGICLLNQEVLIARLQSGEDVPFDKHIQLGALVIQLILFFNYSGLIFFHISRVGYFNDGSFFGKSFNPFLLGDESDFPVLVPINEPASSKAISAVFSRGRKIVGVEGLDKESRIADRNAAHAFFFSRYWTAQWLLLVTFRLGPW
jgi:hypothetical protein